METIKRATAKREDEKNILPATVAAAHTHKKNYGENCVKIIKHCANERETQKVERSRFIDVRIDVSINFRFTRIELCYNYLF